MIWIFIHKLNDVSTLNNCYKIKNEDLLLFTLILMVYSLK
jgi:hypothetical protein